MKILLLLALACVAVSAGGNTFCKECKAAKKAGTQTDAEKEECRATCTKDKDSETDTTTPNEGGGRDAEDKAEAQQRKKACRACQNAVKKGNKEEGDCADLCGEKPEPTPSPVAEPVEEPTKKERKPKKDRDCSKNGDKPKSLAKLTKPKMDKKCKRGTCLETAKGRCKQDDRQEKKKCKKEVGLEIYTLARAEYDENKKAVKKAGKAIKKWAKKCGKGCLQEEQDDGSTKCVNDPNAATKKDKDGDDDRTKEEKQADRAAQRAERDARKDARKNGGD